MIYLNSIDSLSGNKNFLLSSVRQSREGVISYELVAPGLKYQKFWVKVPSHRDPIVDPDLLFDDMPEVEVTGFRGSISGSSQPYQIFTDFTADDIEVI